MRLPAETVRDLDRRAAANGTTRNHELNAALEAGLEDFERADAAKIKDPEARARFINGRLARKAKARGALPGAPGPDGLLDFERVDAAKIKDPEARARFVAKRLQRRSGSKPAPSPATKPAPANGSKPTTRSAPPVALLSPGEFRAYQTRRAKRLGRSAPAPYNHPEPVTVRLDDPDLLPSQRVPA